MNQISVIGLTKAYKSVNVVNNVSLTVNQGEVVGLLGPNGAGKTTTFYMIVGILKPLKGEILYNDKNITNHSMYERARLGIGYLAQESSIFRDLTVDENIRLALEMKGKSKKEIEEIRDLMLEEFHITKIINRMGYALSGGERRRVEIARAIALEPDFILLDEPFAGVDPIAVEDIQEVILHLKRRNLGILITDHNVRETLSITDRSYIMSEGSVLLSGTSESISKDETAKRVYLGEKFKL